MQLYMSTICVGQVLLLLWKGMEFLQARTIPALPNKPERKRKSKRILWLVILLCIVLLAVLFFRSPISKIDKVTFIGQSFVTSERLGEATGLVAGAPFFMVSENEVIANIKSAFPFVKSVKVNKHFPGKIEVFVEEYESVAYELDAEGEVLASLVNGSSVSLSEMKAVVLEKPLLTGWKDKQALELKAKLTKQLIQIPDSLLADISEIVYDPSASFSDRIRMYTRSGFEVITTVDLLPTKLAYLSGVVETQEPGRITMLKADSYISYTNLAKNDHDVLDEQKNSTQ
ncbi:cell division protein FtsQ/DivIB [Paenibacillus agilis]|uniref:cell division protein FtsQ/DivIB n=1 Tax=Paenibacillus agilis TaxID=3020863 RepID=UPI0021BD11D1|nr:FtsQ-type POTRA domain-containing protein [Paenibacillus agilis]